MLLVSNFSKGFIFRDDGEQSFPVPVSFSEIKKKKKREFREISVLPWFRLVFMYVFCKFLGHYCYFQVENTLWGSRVVETGFLFLFKCMFF